MTHGTEVMMRVGFGILLITYAAAADTVDITLDNFDLSGGPGSAVLFTGSLANDSGEEVFLNSAGGSLSYSELTLDPTPFFTFVPLSLADGDSYNGELFSVAISSVALPGDYLGTLLCKLALPASRPACIH